MSQEQCNAAVHLDRAGRGTPCRSLGWRLLRITTAAALTGILAIATGTDTTPVLASSGRCVPEVIISHVPGHLSPVWIVRCVPTRYGISRY